MFIKECKYAVKEKKMTEYVTDDIEVSSDDTDREDSDEKISNEENSHEENFLEKNLV